MAAGIEARILATLRAALDKTHRNLALPLHYCPPLRASDLAFMRAAIVAIAAATVVAVGAAVVIADSRLRLLPRPSDSVSEELLDPAVVVVSEQLPESSSISVSVLSGSFTPRMHCEHKKTHSSDRPVVP